MRLTVSLCVDVHGHFLATRRNPPLQSSSAAAARRFIIEVIPGYSHFMDHGREGHYLVAISDKIRFA
jgi:hypothetical protein